MMFRLLFLLLPIAFAYTDREYWSGDQSNPWARDTYELRERRPDGYDDKQQRMYRRNEPLPELLSNVANRWMYIGVGEIVALSVWVLISVYMCCKPRRKYDLVTTI